MTAMGLEQWLGDSQVRDRTQVHELGDGEREGRPGKTVRLGEQGHNHFGCLALSVGVMIFLLLFGGLILNRVEKTFIDTV
jgi:hypothetical protein